METSIIKKIRQILSKSSKFRDHNDHQFILQHLITRIQFAQEQFCNKFHRLLASACKIEKLKKGTTIFEQYQKTDSLFIILKGTVICIQQKNPDNVHQYHNKIIELQELKDAAIIQSKVQSIEQQLGDECVIIKKYEQGDCINQVEFFKAQKRPFYAVCQQECEMAIISRSDLQQQVDLDKQNYEKGQKNIDFLKKVNIFRNLEKHEQIFREMYFNCKQEHYKEDDVVYNVTYPADYFCIVKKGRFKICKEYEPIGIEKIGGIEVKNKKRNNDGLFYKVENGFTQTVSEGQIFGLDDCVGNHMRRSQVLCESEQGSIMMINKHFLTTRLLNDPLMKNSIQQEIQKQEKLEKYLQADYELKQKKSQVELLRKIKLQIPKLDQKNRFKVNTRSQQSQKNDTTNNNQVRMSVFKNSVMKNLNVNNKKLLDYLETQESYQQDLLESKLVKQNEMEKRMANKLKQYQGYIEKKEGIKEISDRELKFKKLENMKTNYSVNKSSLFDINRAIKTQYSEDRLQQYQQLMDQQQLIEQQQSIQQQQSLEQQQSVQYSECVELNRQMQQNIFYQQQKYSLKRLTTMI